jgi:hypothetical protein
MTQDTTPAGVDWDDIPDTPEQRALIAKHNADMRQKYPNMVEITEHAGTPACDTKTAENAAQVDLCTENAPQDAAKVTVQESALSRLSSATRQRDMEAACDAIDDFDDALRAIARGRND